MKLLDFNNFKENCQTYIIKKMNLPIKDRVASRNQSRPKTKRQNNVKTQIPELARVVCSCSLILFYIIYPLSPMLVQLGRVGF